MNSVITLIFLLLTIILNAQELGFGYTTVPGKNSRLEIEGFAYPTFFNDDMHTSFLVDYKLSKELEL